MHTRLPSSLLLPTLSHMIILYHHPVSSSVTSSHIINHSCEDRETTGLNAADYVTAIAKALLKNDEEASLQSGLLSSSSTAQQTASPKTSILGIAAKYYLDVVLFVDCEVSKVLLAIYLLVYPSLVLV